MPDVMVASTCCRIRRRLRSDRTAPSRTQSGRIEPDSRASPDADTRGVSDPRWHAAGRQLRTDIRVAHAPLLLPATRRAPADGKERRSDPDPAPVATFGGRMLCAATSISPAPRGGRNSPLHPANGWGQPRNVNLSPLLAPSRGAPGEEVIANAETCARRRDSIHVRRCSDTGCPIRATWRLRRRQPGERDAGIGVRERPTRRMPVCARTCPRSSSSTCSRGRCLRRAARVGTGPRTAAR